MLIGEPQSHSAGSIGLERRGDPNIVMLLPQGAARRAALYVEANPNWMSCKGSAHSVERFFEQNLSGAACHKSALCGVL
jgi:hypothetical protein